MLLLVVFVSFTITAISAQSSSLSVTVYYESLCPDSKRFITQQLYPAYQQIGSFLNIEYVPFGKASASYDSGIWSFTCQHGPDECYGNEIQSCVVEQNTGDSVTTFINCAMSGDGSDDSVLQRCAKISNLSWDSITDCYNSGLAAEILVANGNKTDALIPKLSYVPTIVFNGNYDDRLQNEGETNFLPTACRLLNNEPEDCTGM